MKTPDEMMDIVNALYLTLPDEIEQEEMACIFTVLLGMFALNLEWHKIKDRVSNNVADNISADLDADEISVPIMSKKTILKAQKDADDFLGKIVTGEKQ